MFLSVPPQESTGIPLYLLHAQNQGSEPCAAWRLTYALLLSEDSLIVLLLEARGAVVELS